MSPALLQGGGGPKSAEEMDEERKEQIVYEYLCRLEEAKKWIEHLLKEELPEVTIFEQNLRNGVVLAKLASYFAPTVVNSRKIFDIEEHRFEQQGLHFRHTDNINYFLKAISSICNVQFDSLHVSFVHFWGLDNYSNRRILNRKKNHEKIS